MNIKAKNTKQTSAFTLAEVLITLAIIGIVAALTIPTIIQNYKHLSLEISFKKSYSALTKAFVPVQFEFNGNMTSDQTIRDTAFFNALWESYKVLRNTEATSGGFGTVIEMGYSDGKNSLIKSYNNKSVPNPGCPQLPHLLLPDGSAVGGMYNCYANWIVIDSNGKKGPNAFGHDIFYFGIDNTTKQLKPLGGSSYGFWNFADYSTYCSKDSDNDLNGLGCTYWALKNKCPDDETKTYWECLPN